MSVGYDIDALRLAIKTWADAKSGVTFIWADQRGPTPKLPFGTLRLLSYRVVGRPHKKWSNDGLSVEVGNQGVLSVSVQTFAEPIGMSAWAPLEALRGALELPSEYSELQAAGLARSRIPEITNLSDVAGAHPRSRAAMTIDFNLASNITGVSTYIETVEAVADTIDDVDGTTVFNETINIS